jgi:hypothetical protein
MAILNVSCESLCRSWQLSINSRMTVHLQWTRINLIQILTSLDTSLISIRYTVAPLVAQHLSTPHFVMLKFTHGTTWPARKPWPVLISRPTHILTWCTYIHNYKYDYIYICIIIWLYIYNNMYRYIYILRWCSIFSIVGLSSLPLQ